MKNNKSNKAPAGEPTLSEPLSRSSDDSIVSDVNGSYTGHPVDGGIPIQDADDL